MNESEIARRFERRSGYELIDYAEVALPLYRLTVDVVTMVHRGIPPIKEFVLRSIATGFDNVADVADFLGLDVQTTEATIGVARDERYLSQEHSDGSLSLLDRGREVLAKECESNPQDEMLIVLFDGILRRPVWLGSEPLYSPSEINPRTTIEIRPYPSALPEVSDLSIVDMALVLHRTYGTKADFGKDILTLKRIVRRQRVFRKGLALVYRKLRASDVQIAFIVDDARNEALEHTFAERGGPRKMGFVKALDDTNDMAALRRHLGPEVTRLLPDQAELDQRRLKVSTAYLKLSGARRTEDRTRTGREGDGLSELRDEVFRAEQELREFSARPVAVYEPPALLDGALGSAKVRVLISTHQVDDDVLDGERLKALQDALQRGVRVSIRVADIPLIVQPKKFSAIAALGRLERQFKSLTVTRGDVRKLFYLIKDSEFGLVCNRAILGSGRKVRVFGHFSGFIFQTPQLVDTYARRLEEIGG